MLVFEKGCTFALLKVGGLEFLTCLFNKTCLFNFKQRMIDKQLVKNLVDAWLEGKEYFLTDLTISSDNRIVVEIDHKDGVWIEDCVDLSRSIEDGLNRDEEDFELEVGSAGIGQPFKVLRQYENHVGEQVEVVTSQGKKLRGMLASAGPEAFELTVQEKVKNEGDKRPHMEDRTLTFAYGDVKSVKYVIDFK